MAQTTQVTGNFDRARAILATKCTTLLAHDTICHITKEKQTSSLELVQSGRYCIGDPDDCIRYLDQYQPTGVDEMMPLFQVGPITHQEVMETLRLFGRHVIPHFQEEAKKQAATGMGS